MEEQAALLSWGLRTAWHLCCSAFIQSKPPIIACRFGSFCLCAVREKPTQRARTGEGAYIL